MQLAANSLPNSSDAEYFPAYSFLRSLNPLGRGLDVGNGGKAALSGLRDLTRLLAQADT